MNTTVRDRLRPEDTQTEFRRVTASANVLRGLRTNYPTTTRRVFRADVVGGVDGLWNGGEFLLTLDNPHAVLARFRVMQRRCNDARFLFLLRLVAAENFETFHLLAELVHHEPAVRVRCRTVCNDG